MLRDADQISSRQSLCTIIYNNLSLLDARAYCRREHNNITILLYFNIRLFVCLFA